jgi:hypothetical protein
MFPYQKIIDSNKNKNKNKENLEYLYIYESDDFMYDKRQVKKKNDDGDEERGSIVIDIF